MLSLNFCLYLICLSTVNSNVFYSQQGEFYVPGDYAQAKNKGGSGGYSIVPGKTVFISGASPTTPSRAFINGQSVPIKKSPKNSKKQVSKGFENDFDSRSVNVPQFKISKFEMPQPNWDVFNKPSNYRTNQDEGFPWQGDTFNGGDSISSIQQSFRNEFPLDSQSFMSENFDY